jgi:hypothetical protein
MKNNVAGTIVRTCLIVGAFAALSGISTLLYLHRARAGAISLDRQLSVKGLGISDAINSGEIFSLEAEIERRVISINDSEAVSAVLRNDSPNEIRLLVELLTQNFNISPSQDKRMVVILPKREARVTWVISPKGLGRFKIGIQAGLSSCVAGIVVTSVLGLPAGPAEIAGKVSAFLGATLTLPWILRRIRTRRPAGRNKTRKQGSS